MPNQNQTIKKSSQIYGKINLEDLPKGHKIDNRYTIKEKIGQGGFGAVYCAYDEDMNIDKALKIIPEAIVNDKESMMDLQREAQTMIALNHKNIVRVYDLHKNGKIKYIDMEFIDGKTLTEIKLDYKDKKVPEDIVKKYAKQIAEGLSYAHTNNVVHKDIKPQNIMINSNNEIKIMDF
ncbi:MAG: serine/threonine-protein kinase, partial [Candidatus Marinimicrobia bacterium]|nr:serine/threonine-protein kinase [Candidatus Neomarinimicrobiota bacterium]